MEIWLKLDDKNVKDFRFPVVPNDFDFETSNIINSIYCASSKYFPNKVN